MNDWSYGCVAKLLAGAIIRRRSRVATVTATARPAAAAEAVHTAFNAGHQVFDQVVGMLEPARQPHHAVADAELGALLAA